jgi:16S rRNA (uracil1498-N3)-methyltransferase
MGGANAGTTSVRERRFHVRSLTRDDSPIRLEGDELHHLVHVLRLRVGERIALFDGHGSSREGTILRIDASGADIEVGAPLASNESQLVFRLAVSVPKGDRMSEIVQKATELGVSEILPLTSERNERALEGKLGRWSRIALAACKQSGRSMVPSIAPPVDFFTLVKNHSHAPASLWIADPSEPPLKPRADTLQVTACIGPEGGWSEPEIAFARRLGASFFGLGPRTLRTDTAAVAAATLFQWTCGDLSASDTTT